MPEANQPWMSSRTTPSRPTRSSLFEAMAKDFCPQGVLEVEERPQGTIPGSN